MEIDIDSIIYIIISIAVLAVSALKKRKKQSGTSKSEKQSGSSGIFDFIEANFQSNTPDQEEEIQTQYEVSEKEPKSTREKQESYQQLIQNEEKRTIHVSPDNQEKELNEDEIDVSESFDLKEAVIYSEILNRKTF